MNYVFYNAILDEIFIASGFTEHITSEEYIEECIQLPFIVYLGEL